MITSTLGRVAGLVLAIAKTVQTKHKTEAKNVSMMKLLCRLNDVFDAENAGCGCIQGCESFAFVDQSADAFASEPVSSIVAMFGV